jgi:hypothetical protein
MHVEISDLKLHIPINKGIVRRAKRNDYEAIVRYWCMGRVVVLWRQTQGNFDATAIFSHSELKLFISFFFLLSPTVSTRVMTLSRVGWYAWREWRVLVRMIGFISSLVTYSLLITIKYMQYSAIADLHTFQFTVAHALAFSVFISRIPATVLHTVCK